MHAHTVRVVCRASMCPKGPGNRLWITPSPPENHISAYTGVQLGRGWWVLETEYGHRELRCTVRAGADVLPSRPAAAGRDSPRDRRGQTDHHRVSACRLRAGLVSGQEKLASERWLVMGRSSGLPTPPHANELTTTTTMTRHAAMMRTDSRGDAIVMHSIYTLHQQASTHDPRGRTFFL